MDSFYGKGYLLEPRGKLKRDLDFKAISHNIRENSNLLPPPGEHSRQFYLGEETRAGKCPRAVFFYFNFSPVSGFLESC